MISRARGPTEAMNENCLDSCSIEVDPYIVLKTFKTWPALS